MCTVTLAPIAEIEKGFVLTSNRDEAIVRETLPPEIYEENGVRLLFPKDVEAGGTWIGLSDRERAICLLNGGFVKHLRNPPYRKSRGLVVKDLLAAPFLKNAINDYDLRSIEPFTAIIVDYKEELRFLELVWDGTERHLKELPLESNIWSSSLLYSTEEISERRKKYDVFRRKAKLHPESLLKFHGSQGEPGEEGLVIDRGFLKTCSITQITNAFGPVQMWYRDLFTGTDSKIEF